MSSELNLRRRSDGRWSLYDGNLPAHGATWPTLQSARRYAYAVWGTVPVTHVPDAVPWTVKLPVHVAIAVLEARANPQALIVCVTPTHYYIKRSLWGVEDAVRYTVKDDVLHARHDTQPIN